MTLSASRVLEREVGRLIKDDAEVQALFGGEVKIFTSPSETDQLPYIVYNETRTEPWDDDTSRGQQSVFTLEIHTGTESEALVKDLLERLRVLVNWCERRISLSPYRMVMCNHETQDLLRDPEGQTFRGTAQFRATIGGLPL